MDVGLQKNVSLHCQQLEQLSQRKYVRYALSKTVCKDDVQIR